MIFKDASYLMSILIFAGPAVIIEYKIAKRYFYKYWKLLLVLLIISPFIVVLGEPVALKLRIWAYYPESVINITSSFAIETIVFLMFVMVAVAIPTLVWAEHHDRGISFWKKTPELTPDPQ